MTIRLSINHEEAKSTALSQEELRQIYLKTFSTKDGKVIPEDLANVSGMYRGDFIKDSSDYTAFLEGQRSLFLYICSQLEKDVNNNIEGE